MGLRGRGRVPLVEAVAAALAGAVLLAIVLAALSGSRSTQYRAEARLTLRPDAVLTSQRDNPIGTDTDLPTFLATELVTLNGDDLARATAKKLNLPGSASLDAARVEQSRIVSLVATADTAATARIEAQQAAELYVADRLSAARVPLQAQLKALDPQITTLTAQLAVRQRAGGTSTRTDYQAQSLQDRISTLTTQQRAYSSALTAAGEGARISQAALPLATDSTGRRTALYTVFGALLGAVLGLALLLALRRSSHHLHDPEDLDEAGIAVLTPVVPRAKRDWTRRLGQRTPSPLGRAVQLQSVQFLDEAGTERGPLVFVGTGPGVGTSFVAAQHAAHLARSGPTVLLCGGDLSRGQLSRLLGVDPGAPGLSELGFGGPEAPASAHYAQPSSINDLYVVGPGQFDAQSLSDVERAARTGVFARLAAGDWAGWSVVVDAPPLERSSLALDVARHGARVVLVSGRRVSTVDQVADSLRITDAAGVHVSGVVIDDVPHARARAEAAPAPAPAAGRAGALHGAGGATSATVIAGGSELPAVATGATRDE